MDKREENIKKILDALDRGSQVIIWNSQMITHGAPKFLLRKISSDTYILKPIENPEWELSRKRLVQELTSDLSYLGRAEDFEINIISPF